MIDWKRLQMPLIALAIMLTVSGVVWSWARSYHHAQLDEYIKLDRDLNKAWQRYDEARRNSTLYKKYLDNYLSYRNQGIIGEEQRLSWIEELEAVNKQLKFSRLRYEISPQTQAEIPGLTLPNDIVVNSSNMKLTAGVLHEGDLLYLFNGLRKKAKGLFAVTQCELTSRIKKNQQFHYTPDTSYVDVSCELEWYTVEIRS